MQKNQFKSVNLFPPEQQKRKKDSKSQQFPSFSLNKNNIKYVFVPLLNIFFQDNKNYGQIIILIKTKYKSVIFIVPYSERTIDI